MFNWTSGGGGGRGEGGTETSRDALVGCLMLDGLIYHDHGRIMATCVVRSNLSGAPKRTHFTYSTVPTAPTTSYLPEVQYRYVCTVPTVYTPYLCRLFI